MRLRQRNASNHIIWLFGGRWPAYWRCSGWRTFRCFVAEGRFDVALRAAFYFGQVDFHGTRVNLGLFASVRFAAYYGGSLMAAKSSHDKSVVCFGNRGFSSAQWFRFHHWIRYASSVWLDYFFSLVQVRCRRLVSVTLWVRQVGRAILCACSFATWCFLVFVVRGGLLRCLLTATFRRQSKKYVKALATSGLFPWPCLNTSSLTRNALKHVGQPCNRLLAMSRYLRCF